jgi:hypothetical protein
MSLLDIEKKHRGTAFYVLTKLDTPNCYDTHPLLVASHGSFPCGAVYGNIKESGSD